MILFPQRKIPFYLTAEWWSCVTNDQQISEDTNRELTCIYDNNRWKLLYASSPSEQKWTQSVPTLFKTVVIKIWRSTAVHSFNPLFLCDVFFYTTRTAAMLAFCSKSIVLKRYRNFSPLVHSQYFLLTSYSKKENDNLIWMLSGV